MLDEFHADFLLNCIERGENSYQDFRKTRMIDKSKKLFDTIPKMSIKEGSTTYKRTDINKVSLTSLKYIDYARLRGYSVEKLLSYKLVDKSLFLTKDDYLRKSEKSELVRELEKKLATASPISVPFDNTNESSVIVIDFMAYSRRVPIKKLNLTSFKDLFETLLHTFEQLSKHCTRIDIVFDLYLKDSLKEYERMRRSKVDPIETLIVRYDQPLPVEIDRFWASSTNKTKLQKTFIQWIINNFNLSTPVYLGGSHEEDLTMCLHLQNGNTYDVPVLKCDDEEADDRIMLHINHAVTVERFSRVIVASGNTDVFICLLYHLSCWRFSNLKELWVLCGQGNTTRAVPLHTLTDSLDSCYKCFACCTCTNRL